MFWDKAAGFYDIFENWYNGEVNRKLVAEVAELIEPEDLVLECACGTGMISKVIIPTYVNNENAGKPISTRDIYSHKLLSTR